LRERTGPLSKKTVDGPAVAVVQEKVPVLRAPVRGPGWVAGNALASPDHRRALLPVDGRARIAQRFAIHWVRLGPDGRQVRGGLNANANFSAYGAAVVAVADGRISDLRDGLPENVGNSARRDRRVTLDNIVGNYVILALGQGRFALYAHLQPGSLRGQLGDHVTAGQVLARLGNSGNSDIPYLHFQLMYANLPLGAEGLPYKLETFTQLGVVADPAALDAGHTWRPQMQAPGMFTGRNSPSIMRS